MPGYLSELEDGAAASFYRQLESERLMTTRCPECDFTFFPPRLVCPRCLSGRLDWVELPGRGHLYAFTQQDYSMVHGKPEVVGIVELEGCEGRIFTLIEAPYRELELGLPVQVSFFKSVLGMTLHKFSPVE